MKVFTIDTDNNITVFASLKDVADGGSGIEIFTSVEELAGLAAGWPGARLVEIWNTLPGVEPVQRFTSKPVAVKRIWKAIQRLEPAGGANRPRVTLTKRSASKKASPAVTTTVQPNTKTAQLIALLRQPKGATLKTIMQATGWLAHSVRGFISRQVGQKMGLRVRSFKRDGERVYAVKG
jgi:Protein of unknown function (DUF3489)